MENTNVIDIFEDLTPHDNADENDIYTIPIKSGIDNPNIKNIALAGAYGSGKSSILKTFEKKYKDAYNFLNISLADFDGANEKSSIDVERSILQKMFYTVKNEDIPFSRFKRIRDISKKDLNEYSLYSFIWLISIFIVYKNKDLPAFLNFFKADFIYYIALLITLIGIYEFLPKIISIIGNINLSKINLKDGAVDLAENKESSILNKNLDEILYFFKVTNFNVVILEDLDRNTSNIEIFMKLREICLILNNSQEIDRNITFIYAIKDDNFKGEERTKFFDRIIPVIPIIDYSNSGEVLKKMMKKYQKSKGIKELILTNNFIDDICLYIDNMRLLKNIYNEFIIYKDKLQSEKLHNNQLFSILVYKNLCSDDFANLSVKDGLLYKVLNSKKELTLSKSHLIEVEIEGIKEQLKEIGDENITEIQELKNLYIHYTLKQVKVTNNRIIVDNQYIDISSLTFEQLQNSSQIRSEMNSSPVSFSTVKDDIYKKTYSEREKIILKKSNGYIEELKKVLARKEKEKQSLQTLPLSQLAAENINSLPLDGFKQKELLIFLITNGYIDETYSHYISNFYPESITKDDRDFILAVRGRNNNFGYDFKLDRVYGVVKKLHDYEFKQKEILNYPLLAYLLDYPIIYKNKYINFIDQIIDNKDIKFLDGFLEYTNKNIEKLFKDLSMKVPWLWYEVESSNFVKEKKDKYLNLICKHFEVDNIEKMNTEEKLSNYISNEANFIDLCEDVNNVKIEALIKTLNIKFEKLDNLEKNRDFFEYIYNYNHYKITYYFIENILTLFDKNKVDVQHLISSNYSTIQKSSCRYLNDYIEQNIEEYLENVFFTLNTNTNEDVDIVIELLNNEKISYENKEKIIQMQNIKIKNIKDIEDESLWEKLFYENKVEANWDNLLLYYSKVDDMDSVLVEFLNNQDNYTELSKYKLKSENCEESVVKSFGWKIIWSNKLTFDSFSHLLQSNNYTYSSSIISPIGSTDKIIKMIDMDKLSLSQNNLDDLRKKDASFPSLLIEKQIDTFLEKQDDFNIKSNDLLLILESNKITNAQKRIIVENITDLNLIDNQALADKIYIYLKNDSKLDVEYIIKLLENFSKKNNEPKVRLLLAQANYLTDDVFLKLLKYLPEEYEKISGLNGKRTYLDDKTYNKELIKILKDRNFITSDKDDKDGKIRLIIKNA